MSSTDYLFLTHLFNVNVVKKKERRIYKFLKFQNTCVCFVFKTCNLCTFEKYILIKVFKKKKKTIQADQWSLSLIKRPSCLLLETVYWLLHVTWSLVWSSYYFIDNTNYLFLFLWFNQENCNDNWLSKLWTWPFQEIV